MEHLGYTSVVENLAERFHMDERYLQSLNPGVDFTRPGTRIVVASVPRPERQNVTRIVADTAGKQVRGLLAQMGVWSSHITATIGNRSHAVARPALTRWSGSRSIPNFTPYQSAHQLPAGRQ